MGGFVMDGQQHMGIRPPGKAFSASLCLFPRSLFVCCSLLFSSSSSLPSHLNISLGACVFHNAAMLVVRSSSTNLAWLCGLSRSCGWCTLKHSSKDNTPTPPSLTKHNRCGQSHYTTISFLTPTQFHSLSRHQV